MPGKEKLRIGIIRYTNLFPLFYELKKNCDCSDYEFVDGYPSVLNRMLRKGLIDVSPSSSVEYLRGRDVYTYIEGNSISSEGPIGSIILFSRIPLESLDGHQVFVTHQSETSAILLDVILRKFYSVRVMRRISELPFDEAISEHSAYLSIGDEALVASEKAECVKVEVPSADCRLGSIGHQLFYIYDLGHLWLRHTGLPFVFALWTARKDLSGRRRELFERFKDDLDRSRGLALGNLNVIAEASGLKKTLSAGTLVSYWKGISYGLGPRHIEGLGLFESYIRELGLFSQDPL